MERKEHYFDAILMDIVMPKMDGFEAARQIRRVPHKDAQMIPIIANEREGCARGYGCL